MQTRMMSRYLAKLEMVHILAWLSVFDEAILRTGESELRQNNLLRLRRSKWLMGGLAISFMSKLIRLADSIIPTVFLSDTSQLDFKQRGLE